MFVPTVATALFFLAPQVIAGPIDLSRAGLARSLSIPSFFSGNSGSRHSVSNSFSSSQSISFNNYGGFNSMSNFDDFFGSNNFRGSNEEIIIQQESIVCESVQIEIVQQKLVILREMAKRIIIEQICEVEVQTIVLQQFDSGFSDFGRDLSHSSGRQISFDSSISSMISSIFSSDGSLSRSDLGFKGSDVGKHSVSVQGSNWSDSSSPSSVGNARHLSRQASGHNSSDVQCSVGSSSTDSLSSTDTATETATATDSESTTTDSTDSSTDSATETATSTVESTDYATAIATATESSSDSVSTADPSND